MPLETIYTVAPRSKEGRIPLRDIVGADNKPHLLVYPQHETEHLFTPLYG